MKLIFIIFIISCILILLTNNNLKENFKNGKKMTLKNSELVTVDIKPDITKHSLSNINQMKDHYSNSNFNFIKADFKTFLAEEISLDRKYDIIYQDGGKLSLTTMYQLICCYYLLNSGGILIIDDYEWNNKSQNNNDGPKEAVDTFIKFVKDDIIVLHKGYQVILKKN